MTSVSYSSAVSESSDDKKSKADTSIQKKNEAVKRTQAQRMHIELNKSDNVKHMKMSHEETNKDNISHACIDRKVKDILPQTPKNKAVILMKLIKSASDPCLQEKNFK